MNTLKNKIVYISRSREQSQNEIKLLEEAGANVIAFPTIKISAIENSDNISSTLDELESFDYLILSSVNAVKHFVSQSDLLEKLIPEKTSVVAVGDKTLAECQKNNIDVEHIPEEFSAAGIIEMLQKTNMEKAKVLIPSSVIARDELREGLTQLGAEVSVVPFYTNETIDEDDYKTERNKLLDRKPDIFMFTSPSSFENFLNIKNIESPKEYFENSFIAAIGNTTANFIAEKGLKVNLVPKVFTVNQLTRELIESFNK